MRPTAGGGNAITSRVLTSVWLAAVWTALWGSVRVGTVAAGLVIGVVITFAVARGGPILWGTFRPWPAARYLATFAMMLVQATFEVVAAVISPTTRVAPAVVEVALPPSSQGVVTMVSNSITLTPGTITLDARLDADGNARLLVHALDASDPEAIREDALRLHGLATAAFHTAHGREPEN